MKPGSSDCPVPGESDHRRSGWRPKTGQPARRQPRRRPGDRLAVFGPTTDDVRHRAAVPVSSLNSEAAPIRRLVKGCRYARRTDPNVYGRINMRKWIVAASAAAAVAGLASPACANVAVPGEH